MRNNIKFLAIMLITFLLYVGFVYLQIKFTSSLLIQIFFGVFDFIWAICNLAFVIRVHDELKADLFN